MIIKKYLGMDVGTKRIGIALATDEPRIAYPLKTLEVDGSEIESIKEIINKNNIDIVVVGFPRSQTGEKTSQTEYTMNFVNRMKNFLPKIHYQDESLSSISAENFLKSTKKPYSKSDIDSKAAAIILQDYLDSLND